MKLLMVHHNGKSKVIKLHHQESEDGFLRAACSELGQFPKIRFVDGILEDVQVIEYSVEDARSSGHYLNMPVFYMQKETALDELVYGPVFLAKKIRHGDKELIIGFSERDLKTLCRKMRIHPDNLRLHKGKRKGTL
jgi:hypothetical protein